MNAHHALDRNRFSSIEGGEDEKESSQNDNQQIVSNFGRFIDNSLRCINPSRYDIVPYIHVVIVVIAHVLLYGGVSHWLENTPEYLHDTLLDAVLSSNETLRSIKVASVSIGVILFFDLVVDIIQSMIGYYKSEETTQQITFRAKEWTVRTLFILSLVEPACVMLIVPPVPTTPVVIFAYCSAFAKNITFVCMGVFCLSNTFDKTPKEYLRSFLLSASFATGQIFMHYAAMNDQTAGMVLLSQVGLLLSCLPLGLYFYNCMYFLRQIWLKTRREGGFSNVSLREYTFLAYAVSTCLGIVITLIVVFGFNGLYYYNSSLTDLELYDLSIMCYAVLATIVPARIARIEAKQARKRVIVTKRNVTEKLSYPLLEVYLGLDKLLHTNDVMEHLQPADMLRLSQLTLTCNEALHCLEGIVSLDEKERHTLESDSSGEKESTGGTLGHKHFSTRVMSSIVASCYNANDSEMHPPQDPSNAAYMLPPSLSPLRSFLTPPNEMTSSSDQQQCLHPTVLSPMPNQHRMDRIFSRLDSVREQEEQELVSILSNSVFSDPPAVEKQRNSGDECANNDIGAAAAAAAAALDKGALDKGSSDSHGLQLQTRPHINMFKSDVAGQDDLVVVAADVDRKTVLRRNQGLSTTTTIRFDLSTNDEKEAEANEVPPHRRPPPRRFGGAFIKSSHTLMQTALGRQTFSATGHSHNHRQALPSIPEATQPKSTQSSQKSEPPNQMMVADEAVEMGNDGNVVEMTVVAPPWNEERVTWEVIPTPATLTDLEQGLLPLSDVIAEQLNTGRRWTSSEVTSEMDKTSADYSAVSFDDTPSYTFTYDYSFNANAQLEEDKPLEYDEHLPPRIPLSAKVTPLQLYSKLPSQHMVRTRYSQLDGTNPQLLELVATSGVRHPPRMLHPTLDIETAVDPIAQRRAYIRSVSSSVALGFVPIGSAAGVDSEGQPLGSGTGGGCVGDSDVVRETKGADAIALFTWRLLTVVRADLRAASDLFDLQLSSLLAEPTTATPAAPSSVSGGGLAVETTSKSSSSSMTMSGAGVVSSAEDRLREAFLLKCAQWKAMEEDGMVELRAHLNVVQTMVLKAAVSLSVTLDCVLLSDAVDREDKLDGGERDRRPESS